jgi:hypothetical protein
MNADTHRLIAERAYVIWEREGRPEGRAWLHWLQAEAEYRACEQSLRVFDPYSFEIGGHESGSASSSAKDPSNSQ